MDLSDRSRNTPGRSGDDQGEMFRRDRFDERTADAVLAGRGGHLEGDELADIAAFVTAVQAEASLVPARPNATLAEVLAHGISADKGELPVTAASNVNGPATQVSGPPKRRIRTMLELLATKLAALGLAAKAGIAGAAVVATTASAGAAGVLPDTLQQPFDNTVRGGVEQSDDTDEIEVTDEISGDNDAPVETDGFGVDGEGTADDARDGELVGEDVADDASDGLSTEGRERAEDGPDNAPEELPTETPELPTEVDEPADERGEPTEVERPDPVEPDIEPKTESGQNARP